jgi:hypothetical protein
MSYVSQQFLLLDNSSTANFKNWAKAISDALTSMGWATTSDTGQVNWSTVTVPGSGVFVYEVWKPTDALQTGSTQFFMKVKYGTGSGSPAGPRLQFQLGTGTDGAGNLTGFTTTNIEVTQTNATGQGSVATYDCYFSGDTDRFSCMMWRSFAAAPTHLTCIERTRNTDGTNSSDGVNQYHGTNTAATCQQTIVFSVGLCNHPVFNNNRYCMAYDQGNDTLTGAFNNNVPVFPVFPLYGKVGNPSTTLAFIRAADVAEGCIFTTTLYGATRTYIASSNFTLSGPSPNTTFRLCMRYD